MQQNVYGWAVVRVSICCGCCWFSVVQLLSYAVDDSMIRIDTVLCSMNHDKYRCTLSIVIHRTSLSRVLN